MKGFLFIGDPHVSSIRPGRRKDDFVASVLGKLAAAAEIARREDLLPVILGDLFHRPRENHLPTLSRLIDVLKQFHVTPLCLGGNHDKEENSLTQTDALQLLAQVGVLEVFDGECQLARTLDTDSGRVALWAAPYGARLPTSIDPGDADRVILITHHDLAFEGAYPGAAELTAITGCDLVVNGHMHKTAPSIHRGRTHWHCPGNIEPLSVDCREHVPSVWAWRADQAPNRLHQHILPHERDCFDMTGLAVAASSTKSAIDALSEVVVPELPAPAPSHFAELLGAQATLEAARTEDSVTFLEDLELALTELKVSGSVRQLLVALANQAPAPLVVEG